MVDGRIGTSTSDGETYSSSRRNDGSRTPVFAEVILLGPLSAQLQRTAVRSVNDRCHVDLRHLAAWSELKGAGADADCYTFWRCRGQCYGATGLFAVLPSVSST
jgi:hypothetical protein